MNNQIFILLVIFIIRFLRIKFKRVTFKDDNFEEAIRVTISKPIGNISINDLKQIEVLNCSSKNIINIEGIQYCKNLRRLFLDDNNICDISPLFTHFNTFRFKKIKGESTVFGGTLSYVSSEPVLWLHRN